MGGVVQLLGQFLFCIGGMLPFAQPGFQLPLTLFDGPVVAGCIVGAVDGDDHMFFQKLVHRSMVQVAGVVPLDEQRRSEAAEVPGQMTGDLLPARFGRADQGRELVTGTQVLDVLDMAIPVLQAIHCPR